MTCIKYIIYYVSFLCWSALSFPVGLVPVSCICRATSHGIFARRFILMIRITRKLPTRLAIMTLCYLVAACEAISFRIVGPFTLATAVSVAFVVAALDIVHRGLKLGGQFLDCCGEFGIATRKLAD